MRANAKTAPMGARRFVSVLSGAHVPETARRQSCAVLSRRRINQCVYEYPRSISQTRYDAVMPLTQSGGEMWGTGSNEGPRLMVLPSQKGFPVVSERTSHLAS